MSKDSAAKRAFISTDTSSNKKQRTDYYTAAAFQTGAPTSMSTTSSSSSASSSTSTALQNTALSGPIISSAPTSPTRETDGDDDDYFVNVDEILASTLVVKGTLTNPVETQAEVAESIMKSIFGPMLRDDLETIEILEPCVFIIEVHKDNVHMLLGKQNSGISFSETTLDKRSNYKPGNMVPVFSISHSKLDRSEVLKFFASKNIKIDGVTISEKCTTVWIVSIAVACEISALGWNIISNIPVRFVLASGDRSAIPKIRVRCKTHFKVKIFTQMVNNMLRKANLLDCSLVEIWRTKKGQYRGSATVYLLDWEQSNVTRAIQAIDGKGPANSLFKAVAYNQ